MSELRECPFCGSKKVGIHRDYDHDGFGVFVSVKCQECSGQGAQHFVTNGNDCPIFYKEVCGSWNRRASPVQAEPVAMLVKSKHGDFPRLGFSTEDAEVYKANDATVEPLYAHPPSGKDAEQAEMYRWLRDSGYGELYVHGLPGIDNCKQIAGEGLDEAIRAAMSEEGRKG